MRRVTAKEEWCAEAYLETRYDRLTQEDFFETVRNFYLFNMKNAGHTEEPEEEVL